MHQKLHLLAEVPADQAGNSNTTILARLPGLLLFHTPRL
jgi:hypothetical protein